MTRDGGDPLLAIEGLCVAYGAVKALTNADLTVHGGEIVTVIGPNGAGKTSMLRGLAGLAPVTSGRARLDGASLLRMPAHKRPARGLVLVPEGRQVFGELSILENLYVGAHTRPATELKEDLEQVYRLFPVLATRSRQPAATLSGGEQQMLAIGRGLMARPKLLMLDEPSLGLAPKVVRQVMELLQTLRTTGVSLLLVEQNARLALTIADHAYVLRTGQIVASGPSHELAQTDEIRRRYFKIDQRSSTVTAADHREQT